MVFVRAHVFAQIIKQVAEVLLQQAVSIIFEDSNAIIFILVQVKNDRAHHNRREPLIAQPVQVDVHLERADANILFRFNLPLSARRVGQSILIHEALAILIVRLL